MINHGDVYPRVGPMEEVFPEMQGYRMACCDCGLVHELNFRVVQVTGQTGDVIHTREPDNVDSLRIVLTADRDDDETDRVRVARGLSEEPELDAMIRRMVTHYPVAAIMHAFDRVEPGMRGFLTTAALSIAKRPST